MMLCKVNIPFTDKETKEQYKAGAEIELSEKRIAEIRTVNVNMISVIREIEPEAEPEETESEEVEPEAEPEAEKPKATRKKKA